MSRAPRSRRLGAAAVLGALWVLFGTSVTSAHPLGNFTINHYTGIRVATDGVTLDHVLDMAEIPTFSERSAMDTDGDLAVSDAEAAAYRDATCESTRTALQLSASGTPLDLETVETGIAFPQGQGAVTLRLVCTYRAALPVELPVAGAAFTFRDPTWSERRGWREIVVQGDGTLLSASDAPAAGTSGRLRTYPTDLLATPADQSTASWTAVPGGAALPPLDIPDAAPRGSVDPGVGGIEPPASIPGGVGDLGADVTQLFQARDLTLPVVALSLLVAAGLGALHAVSPGHGKTVMAAYLVGSRGTARQAVGLGLTVTVSHTLGVLVLAGVSLSATAIAPPERLYPILGVVSGIIVVVIGVWLVLGRVRVIRAARAMAHVHDHAHAHGLDHDHGVAHAHADSHVHAVDADGWHRHGGRRHTHLPSAGQPLRWRGLFALGLAGGMVPSVSALIVLLGSIGAGRPAYGIVLTIAFGVGMAVVLVGIGMGLVYARGIMERMPSAGRLTRVSRLVPTATAFIVLAAGLLITTQAVSTLR